MFDFFSNSNNSTISIDATTNTDNDNIVLSVDDIDVSDVASDTRRASWHGIGTDISSCNSVEDMLSIADLDYRVSKSPVYTNEGMLIPGVSATVSDRGHVFGVVSNKYAVTQNVDAFGFMDEIDGIKFVKAGMTYTGMVYAIGRLPSVRVLDDNFTPYVIVQNGHNGRYNIKATICPLRIVCQNQFAYAFAHSANTVSIKHSALAEGRLSDAHATIIASANAMSTIASDAERYAGIPVNDVAFYRLVGNLFPVDDDASERVKNGVTIRKNAFIKAYESGDNANYRGTAWGVINAYADYLTHISGRNTDKSAERKFLSVTFNPEPLTNLMSMLVA